VRLLVLTPDFPPARGGIQTLVHRLAENIQDMRVRVLTLDRQGAATFDAAGSIDVRRTRLFARRPLSIALLNAAAFREALRFRPDVILSAHIVVSPSATAMGLALRVPVVQYVYAKEMGAKPRLSGMAVRRAAATIAISRYCEELAIGVGAPPSRLRRIPPGVDLPEGRGGSSGRRPECGDRPRVITVARLEDRYKGHDVITRAMPLVRARVPAIEWVVIGEGPLRGELERLAIAHGVGDCIRFLGAVEDAVRDEWFCRSRVFAMPSRLPASGLAGEGFGIVYLEAGARGLPVVAGNVAGPVDAVAHGATGLLVDPNDHVAVADALISLLEDPDLAERLGRAGVDHARRFSWPVMAQRVADVVRSVTPRCR
jgi:phosphatidyl-myo-inositol dimannoside synthase